MAALGVLLKHYAGKYPEVLHQDIFTKWLSELPLNTDKIEGDKQQEFLLEILTHDPSILIKKV